MSNKMENESPQEPDNAKSGLFACEVCAGQKNRPGTTPGLLALPIRQIDLQNANFNWNRITRPPPSAKFGTRNRPAGEVNTFDEIVKGGAPFGGFTNALAL